MSNAIKTVILVVVTSLVALVAGELVARTVFPSWAPRTGRLADLWHFDRDYGWAYVPGSSGPFRSHSFDTQVTINQDGFRGPPIGPPSPSRPRVVVLGDSYVFGYGVEQDEIFTSRLQAACPGLDVVNLGVSGYSTDQELLLLQQRGLGYQPDLVVLVMVDNDYENNLRPRVYVYYEKPVYVVEGDRLVLTNHPVEQPSFLVRWAGRIARHSYLLNQTNRVLVGWRQSMRQSGNRAANPPETKTFPTSPAEAITARLVSAFIDTVEEAGAKTMIVFVEGQAGRSTGMEAYLAGRDVVFVPLDSIIPPNTYDQYRLNDDPHWNPAGHALVARAIEARLGETGVVPAGACDPAD